MRFIFDVSEVERGRLEVIRQARGLRSLAETVRKLIEEANDVTRPGPSFQPREAPSREMAEVVQRAGGALPRYPRPPPDQRTTPEKASSSRIRGFNALTGKPVK